MIPGEVRTLPVMSAAPRGGTRELVLARIGVDLARPVVGMARPGSLLTDLGEGWVAVAADGDPDAEGTGGLDHVAAALSGVGRSVVALTVWWDAAESGYLLFGKGRVCDAHIWTAGAVDPGVEELVASTQGDAAILVRRLRAGDPVLFRALLRRTGDPVDLLGEFLGLAGIPGAAWEHLRDGGLPADLAGAVEVGRRTVVGAWREMARQPWPGEPRWISAGRRRRVRVGVPATALLIAVVYHLGVGDGLTGTVIVAGVSLTFVLLALRGRRGDREDAGGGR